MFRHEPIGAGRQKESLTLFNTVLVTHRVVENQITNVFYLFSGPLG